MADQVLTPVQSARYVRQIMLSEVGVVGQAAVCAATAHVGGSPMAELYAQRAGFAQVADGAVDLDALAPTEIVRSEGARRTLAAARAVLGEVQRVLDEAAK